MQAAATGRAAPPPREAWSHGENSARGHVRPGVHCLYYRQEQTICARQRRGRAHRDGEAFVLQAELGVREGSLPAVQVGDLIRQVHLLEPRPLRRPQ